MINNVKQLLENSVELYKEKILYKIENTEISYEQVYNIVNSLGTTLIKMGLKDKKIAIISENRYEWEIAYFAVISGTGVVVPIDKSLPKTEIKSILKRAEIEAVFCSSKYENILKEIRQEQNELKYIISFDNKNNDVLNFNDLVEEGEKLINLGDNSFKDLKIEISDLATILFTSGTTDKSKAVMLSHKNICSNIMNVAEVFDITSNDIALSVLPLNHVLEGIFCFLVSVYKGLQRVHCNELYEIIEYIKKYNITYMGATPAIYEYIYKRIDELEDYKHNINMFMSGGASLDTELEQNYKKLGYNIVNGYGLTEASPVVSIENIQNYKIGSVGKFIPNIEFEIINQDEQGVGELIVKGESVFLGYYKDEEKTNETIKDGWLYTGDLARIDEEGYLYIIGRNKNMIVLSNGKKVFPEEIESLLNKIDGIEESLVFANQSNNSFKICAKIVCNKSVKKAEDMMKEIVKLNDNLPIYKRINKVTFLQENLEKTSSGKIKRNTQKKEDNNLAKIKEILSNQLDIDVEQINKDSDIVIHLGADSLDRVEIFLQVEKEFNVKISKEKRQNIKFVSDLMKVIE